MKRSIKIGVGCLLVCLIGVVVGFLVFPKVFRNQISEEVSLKPGSDSRALWTKLPFPMEFKIYIFNVTNPEEIQTGSVPIVKEIGPYQYDFWREKIDQVDNELDDSITFKMKTTWFFNQEKSAPLTGDEQIVIPHPFILGLGVKVAESKPGMLGIVNRALPIIYDNQTDLFLRTSAKEALFKGFIIKCNREEFQAQAVCIGMKDEGKGLEELEGGDLKYSFFGYRNNTALDSFTISRGLRNVGDLGKVLKFRGSQTLDMWMRDDEDDDPPKKPVNETKSCTKLRGTDSTIFPPFLEPSEGLWSFSSDICRSTAAIYEGEGYYKGIPIRRYNATFGDPKTDPDAKCYCPKDPRPCPLAADPKLVKDIKGLNPDKDKHGIFVDFESAFPHPKVRQHRALGLDNFRVFWGLGLDSPILQG
ncbi:sensory neuron membrane protein 1 [Ctenocephalides felis]|uniref:sensory neuron membrane protein 1 n=1 Tax=Ctenocephalides felis TaxID=7515 RepID=UPI000E6E3663|nr:sensory neuron membrane protein 1 [Ctenocephalides felis]